MSAPRTPRIPYGGDHNPEQWPRDVWDDDHRLFTRAGTDTHDFTVPDRTLDRVAGEGRRVCPATGTAALAPWLAPRHPEVNRTDFEGRRHRYGQRHTFCSSSPAYRAHTTALASRLAGRYAHHPAVRGITLDWYRFTTDALLG